MDEQLWLIIKSYHGSGNWRGFLHKNTVKVHRQPRAADFVWEELMIPSHQSRRGEMKPHFCLCTTGYFRTGVTRLFILCRDTRNLGLILMAALNRFHSASLPQVLQPTEERGQVRMLGINKWINNIAIVISTSLITLHPSALTSQSRCFENLSLWL